MGQANFRGVLGNAVSQALKEARNEILCWHPSLGFLFDLAVIDWVLPREEFHDYLRRLVRAGFGKRLMFGSDQMVWPQTIEIGIKAIESADFLTAEQKRDIFYNNAARFLRIEEKNKAPR